MNKELKQYPWLKADISEQLPGPNTKQDFFDAAVKYPASKVKEEIGKSPLSHLWLSMMDSNIYCLPKDKIDQMLSEIGTNHLHYLSDRNDCDKFALKFASECVWTYGTNGVGIIVDYAGAHAYNCLVIDGGKDKPPTIEIVEPQTDGLISKPDTHHTFKNGLLLLF